MPWPGAKLRGERGASAMRATTVGMAAAAAALVAARARGLAELRCCAATQRERLAQHRSAIRFKYKLRPYTGTPIPYGRAILWMWYAQYSIV